MEIKLQLERSELAPVDRLLAPLWVRIGEVDFPARGWWDAPLPVLEWWDEAMRRPLTEPTLLLFMEGPFALEICPLGQDVEVHAIERGRDGSKTVARERLPLSEIAFRIRRALNEARRALASR